MEIKLNAKRRISRKWVDVMASEFSGKTFQEALESLDGQEVVIKFTVDESDEKVGYFVGTEKLQNIYADKGQKAFMMGQAIDGLKKSDHGLEILSEYVIRPEDVDVLNELTDGKGTLSSYVWNYPRGPLRSAADSSDDSA